MLPCPSAKHDAKSRHTHPHRLRTRPPQFPETRQPHSRFGGSRSSLRRAANRRLTEKEKLARIAANSYPLRFLFPTRGGGGRANPKADEMKKKYGAITALDYPQFTKDTFPGLYQMDISRSSLFGDMADDSMFEKQQLAFNGTMREISEFNPAAPNSKKWLDKLAAKLASTGTRIHHISNNAPRDICDLDPGNNGIAVAKKWLDGAAIIGAKSMRVNTGGPRLMPGATVAAGSYPKNDEITVYLTNAIESFKEMADHGAKTGVKVTIENHWGLSANPSNVRVILEEVNHPFCEASPTSATGSTSTCSTMGWPNWLPMPTPPCMPSTGTTGRLTTSSAPRV